jgi:IclR family transcriptional regulator, acetate operon repressor
MRENYQLAPSSVDHALRLLQLLATRGSLRVTEAASELGISSSAAQRYLSALRDHGFAVQGSGRAYAPGPSVLSFRALASVERSLVHMIRPHVEALNDRLNESVHVLVLRGSDVNFVMSLESRHPLRITSRYGVTMPARVTSGGKALLACLDDGVLDSFFTATGSEDEVAALKAEIGKVREQGYGENFGESGRGTVAVGMAITTPEGPPIAAITVALPSPRATPESLAVVRRELAFTVAQAQAAFDRERSPRRPRLHGSVSATSDVSVQRTTPNHSAAHARSMDPERPFRAAELCETDDKPTLQ